MSYEDTKCPCGDKKPTDTMFCDACETYLAGRREMELMKNDTDLGMRRHCAFILLSLSRGRKRVQANVPPEPRR